MKQGTMFLKVVIGLLFITVVLYFSFSLLKSKSTPYQMVPAYTYTNEDSVTITGYLIREEVRLPGVGGLVSFNVREGEKAHAGQTIAVVYQDQEAMTRQQTLRSLTEQLSQQRYALSDESASGEELEKQLTTTMESLRVASSKGDYDDLAADGSMFKNLVLRRENLYADASAGMGDALLNVTAQIAELSNAGGSDASGVTAPSSGIFTSQVDFLETVFVPQALEDLTVSTFQSLVSHSADPDDGAIGKLVTSERWYLVATVSAEDAEQFQLGPFYKADAPKGEKKGFTVGSRVKIRFTNRTDAVTMQIYQISEEEDGQFVVSFTTLDALSSVLSLRRQDCDLIFYSQSGIHVPHDALYTRDKKERDENGNEITVTEFGVYTAVGHLAEWRPVQVVSEGKDFYVVQPDPSEEVRILRAGDEVILSSMELYDGKVVR